MGQKQHTGWFKIKSEYSMLQYKNKTKTKPIEKLKVINKIEAKKKKNT